MREWEYEWLGMRRKNKVFPDIYAESYKKLDYEKDSKQLKIWTLLGGINEKASKTVFLIRLINLNRRL